MASTVTQNQTNQRVIRFMSASKVVGIVAFIYLAICIFLIVVKGLNFGVDFNGGVKLVYQFGQSVSDGDIRKVLEPMGFGDAEIIRYGQEKENSYLVKVKFLGEKNSATEISAALKETLNDPSITLLSEESVGPKVGAELRKKGLLAIVLTWVLILVYVGLRFDFLFAPGAIVALIHDVIVTLGFFVFFGKEFNLPILAAVLTIIGFSINDTIVIYDRIRENLKKLPVRLTMGELIDISLTETLSRTIVTSLTVLFAVVVLFILGGGVLHDFAFCMIVGVIFGSYSSIFVASPIYLALVRLFPKKGLVRGIGK